MPSGFIPEEDQGYLFGVVQLPRASSLAADRCRFEGNRKHPAQDARRRVRHLHRRLQPPKLRPEHLHGIFFITLEEWSKRKTPELQVDAIQAHINRELAALPKPTASFAFPPPAIPGVGTAGGVTFILEDRSGAGVEFIAKNTQEFMLAAKKRPELTNVFTIALWDVPQYYVSVDQAQAMIQGVSLSDAYQTLQTFLGGYFVNYFNRFGLQWQVYIQAEGDYRTEIDNLGLFYVANKDGDSVPINSFVNAERSFGPEFIMRYNMYRCSQINAAVTPGYSTGQAMKALEGVFAETMPNGMGFDYLGMSFQEQKAAQGVPASAIFGLSLLFVFLILAAQYESWSLPFSVLLTTPIAVFGAFAGLLARGMQNNLYAQIGLVMLIGLAAKNAILIVEFAKDEYEKGKPLFEATLSRRQAALAADPHDRFCLHPRHGAAGYCDGFGSCLAAGFGNNRHRRHAGSHLHLDLPHSRIVLLRGEILRWEEEGRRAGSARRPSPAPRARENAL